MRISDWSSDVCSSVLQIFEQHAEIVLGERIAVAVADAADVIGLDVRHAERGARDLGAVSVAVACMTAIGLRRGTAAAGSQNGEQKNTAGVAERSHHFPRCGSAAGPVFPRSDEPTSELQSLIRISYAGICLQK